MNFIPWKNKQEEGSKGETSPLTNLRSEMNRLFDSFVRDPFGPWDWPFAAERHWSPVVDVADSDDEVTIRAEIPGMDAEDLEVTVTGNQVVLAGEKKESTEKGGKGFHHTESRFGTFRRTIPLPEGVDPQKVDAEYANGVLLIRLKKSPAVPAKRIEVKVKS